MPAQAAQLNSEADYLDEQCKDQDWSVCNGVCQHYTNHYKSLKIHSILREFIRRYAVENPEYYNWLMMLADPGSSLGGARPKTSVKDKDDSLWIAKFPSRSDKGDIGGWEMVAYQLALQAGINMAESKVQKFSSDNYTFLTRRFDRTPKGERLHFASAMTMLERQDMQDHSVGASYLEIVEFITTHGARVEEDLKELWRRIVFSICVSNTDDHLRNHGFLLTEKGWMLSPAYDINPNEFGRGLSLNISEDDNALDIDLALEVSDFFRLSEERAREIIDEVKLSVRNWRTIATKCGISRSEQDIKAIAFQKAEEANSSPVWIENKP